MRKFKQGDLVRLTKDYPQYLSKGEVGRIYTAEHNNPVWFIEIPYAEDIGIEDGAYPFFRTFVHEDYLELAEAE